MKKIIIIIRIILLLPLILISGVALSWILSKIIEDEQ